MDTKIQFKRWRERVEDVQLAKELEEMHEADAQEDIEDAFYRSLSFGTAGLRGVLGAGTNRMNVYTVRRATQGIACYIQQFVGDNAAVAICYDSRINSQRFAQEAACVLAANGVHSYLYSRLEPTPALSFATRYLSCAIGINITASHNPSQYNGYKVYGPDGCQITDKIAQAITAAIESTDYFDDVRTMKLENAISSGLVSYIDETVLDAYLDAVYSQSLLHCERGEDLKVVYTPLNGTGLECVNRILEKIGMRNVTVVGEQAQPDGAFPTCPYPNPESRDALQKGLELSEQVGADILIATDPDADRVGVAVRTDSGFELLTGNEIGALLLDFICTARIENARMPKDPVAVTTIVSTSIVDDIARAYQVDLRRVLTGFKYIGGVIAQLEEQGHPERFIFGFEESYGYLAGTHARDKDAIVAVMLICEMARAYRNEGKTLYDAMQELYERFGYHRNRTLSFVFEGAAGSEKMEQIMTFLRSDPPQQLDRYEVSELLDYKKGINGLPSADVLEFQLENGGKIIVRPSGTEPKIKVYVFALGQTASLADEMGDRLEESMKGFFE